MSDDTYKKLFVSGSGPGILYCELKVHRNNFSTQFLFQPIFAAYKSASYKIFKFLVPILTPLTTNQYTIDNSYSFVKDILKVDNANNFFMASFDIENLFTNIPLHETIEICLNHLFPSPQSTVIGLERNF